MKEVGIVGLGDMGIGMARNLLKNGFELWGYDLRPDRLMDLASLGGRLASDCRQVVENSGAVFVMVLNGQQVHDVVLGESGLLEGLRPGTTIIVSATIHPSEVRALEQPVYEKRVNLIDTPVIGGKPGAENGTLTLIWTLAIFMRASEPDAVSYSFK